MTLCLRGERNEPELRRGLVLLHDLSRQQEEDPDAILLSANIPSTVLKFCGVPRAHDHRVRAQHKLLQQRVDAPGEGAEGPREQGEGDEGAELGLEALEQRRNGDEVDRHVEEVEVHQREEVEAVHCSMSASIHPSICEDGRSDAAACPCELLWQHAQSSRWKSKTK